MIKVLRHESTGDPHRYQLLSGSPSTLVLGEEIFKICAGKVAGEPFLTQDITDGFGLGLLQFPYLLFDRTR